MHCKSWHDIRENELVQFAQILFIQLNPRCKLCPCYKPVIRHTVQSEKPVALSLGTSNARSCFACPHLENTICHTEKAAFASRHSTVRWGPGETRIAGRLVDERMSGLFLVLRGSSACVVALHSKGRASARLALAAQFSHHLVDSVQPSVDVAA